MGTHSWVLAEDLGLYFLTGRNDLNPNIGRNGTGKTSLLEAITWCLYGKTTRGLKAGDVVNRSSKGCAVTVNLIVGDEELTIIATQGPNSLSVNDQTVDREALVKRLRLNYESFCYSVILPQFGDAFFDLAPAAKLNLFSQIMELDYWLEASQEAQAISSEIERRKLGTEREIAGLSAKVETLTTSIEELQIKSDQWEYDQAKKLEGLPELKAKCLLKIQQAKEGIAELAETSEKLIIEIGHLTEDIKEIDLLLDENDVVSSKVSKELAIVQHDIQQINNIPRECLRCQSCLQTIHGEHKEIAAKALKQLKSKEIALLKQQKAFSETKKTLIGEMKRVVSEHDQLKFKEVRYKGEINSLNNEITYLESDTIKLDREISQINNEKNEFAALLATKSRELEKTELDLGQLENEILILNEEYEATYYWVGGFKKLRLYIVEETLRSLEIEVNNNLASLGLVDWRIEFDIERENKSGGVTKGFTVLIYAPGSDKPIKFETFSGGETQLLRLAGTLGLANLICERAGLVNQSEFYDEPSSHLSKEAVIGLAETLHQRAITSGKQIWVIDHQAIDFGDFAGVVTVVKDGSGSKIHQSN